MNVVENRNRMWKKAQPIMDVMYGLLKVFVPKRIAKSMLEKKRFKTGWVNMAWRYTLLKRIGTKFIGGGTELFNPMFVYTMLIN